MHNSFNLVTKRGANFFQGSYAQDRRLATAVSNADNGETSLQLNSASHEPLKALVADHQGCWLESRKLVLVNLTAASFTQKLMLFLCLSSPM